LIKFFLDQHGCVKNQVDGETLIARLRGRGYERAQEAQDADVIIVNTCGFIESAKKESLEALFNAKKAYPRAKIIAAGCLAERYAQEFEQSLPEADGVFGAESLLSIANELERVLGGTRIVTSKNRADANTVASGNFADAHNADGSFQKREELLSFPGSAYVKISEGCGNFCSFCAIPLIRGAPRSRTIESITREIEFLLTRGIFEINLIAQDVSSYGGDFAASNKSGQSPLALLLDSVSRVEGDFWIRLLYMHPDHFPLDILPRIKNDSRILPYFDIPFQSGSDSIIKAMNRTGTAARYENLIETIRAGVFPREAAFRTTMLAGFPGETDEDAERTQDFLCRIQADWAGVFEYSREEGTASYAMKNQVSKKPASMRAAALKKIQSEITQKKLTAHIGTTQTALVEEVIAGEDQEGGENFALARAWFQAPEVDGSCVIRYDDRATDRIRAGSAVQVMITGSSGIDLTGEFC
jgi:ribosomal protein S12 methylthiotransferase